RLDDRAARPQPAAPLGLGDHGDGNAILDAAAGVHRLDLDADRGLHAFDNAAQLDQRCASDRLKDGFLHVLDSPLWRLRAVLAVSRSQGCLVSAKQQAVMIPYALLLRAAFQSKASPRFASVRLTVKSICTRKPRLPNFALRVRMRLGAAKTLTPSEFTGVWPWR